MRAAGAQASAGDVAERAGTGAGAQAEAGAGMGMGAGAARSGGVGAPEGVAGAC